MVLSVIIKIIMHVKIGSAVEMEKKV